jgi:acyl carrier protein
MPDDNIDPELILGSLGYGLNSILFLELLIKIENTFQIQIQDDHWSFDKLDNISKITDYISYELEKF